MINISIYTNKELGALINSTGYKHFDNLPISKQRAFSYLKNPRANPEDPVLFIAFNQENQIIGYRLILPDKIYINEKSVKVGWFSCVWTDPKKRGYGIAKKLVNESLKQWNYRVMLQNPAPEAFNLSKSTGYFSDKIVLEGLRCYYKWDLSTILYPKHKIFRLLNPFLKTIDIFFNLFNQVRLKAIYPFLPDISPSNIEYISELDEETADFIEQFQQQNIFRRKKEDFNWILKYPWISEAPTQDIMSKRYHFSTLKRQYNLTAVKFLDHNRQIAGFAIISIIQNHLKTPYVFVNDNYLKHIAGFIYRFARSKNVKTLTTFQPQLASYFKNNLTPSVYKKKIKKNYLISHSLIDNFKKSAIHEGDGDAVFT